MPTVNAETYQLVLKKLENPSAKTEGIDMLKEILSIKQAHLWRSDAIAPCCGGNLLESFACHLSEEVHLLEKAIDLLENDSREEIRSIFERLQELMSKAPSI